jgi:hypothetical protein
MEYAAATHLEETQIPAELFDVRGLRSWCPRCFDGDGAAAPAVEDLGPYLAILDRLYRSTAFLERSWFREGTDTVRIETGDPAVASALAHSSYLQYLFRPAQGSGRGPGPQ